MKIRALGRKSKRTRFKDFMRKISEIEVMLVGIGLWIDSKNNENLDRNAE